MALRSVKTLCRALTTLSTQSKGTLIPFSASVTPQPSFSPRLRFSPKLSLYNYPVSSSFCSSTKGSIPDEPSVGPDLVPATPIVMSGAKMTLFPDCTDAIYAIIYGDGNINYLLFNSVEQLDVGGDLTVNPNTTYNAIFSVKFDVGANGWDDKNLVTMEVTGPGDYKFSKQFNVSDTKQMESGNFTTPDNDQYGKVTFHLTQNSGTVKKGLIIKSFRLA